MISSDNRRAGPYAGDGATVIFPFNFKIFSATDLRVVKANGGTETDVTTGFSVALNSNQDTAPGGYVTFVTAPIVGDTITLTSNMPAVQPMQLTNGGGFFPSVLNTSADRATILIQQLAEQIGRALVAPISSDEPLNGLAIPDAASRAGKILAFDGSGRIIPIDSGVAGPGDGSLRTDLAKTSGPTLINTADGRTLAARLAALLGVGGASEVGYKQGATGSVTRTVFQRLQDFPISVKDFGAVGDGSHDDTAAINAAIAAASSTFRAEVYFPAGDYKVTSTITVPLLVSLRGPATPFPQAAYNPTYVNAGAVLFKAHNSHCIVKAGAPAGGGYQQAGGFYNIGIRSNYNDYPNGDGFFIDYVGNFEMQNCAVYSVGQNAFHVGYTATDVTGNILLLNCYVNNPGTGAAYSLRGRWILGIGLISDGGAFGLDMYNCVDCHFLNCHHEGVQTAGIRLSGTSVNNVFDHHFVLCNYPSGSQPAVLGYFVDPGSDGHKFVNCKFNGDTTTPRAGYGIQLVANMTRTIIEDCYVGGWVNGLYGIGTHLTVRNTLFFTTTLPIEMHADDSFIEGIITDTTSGSYSIDHQGGGGGRWVNNFFDKPIKATATGAAGNFGTNFVANNKGFKTRFIGTTGSNPSGTATPHGLGGVPIAVFAEPVSPFTRPSAFTVGYDATNITPTWSGGGNVQLSLMAYLPCEAV